MRVTQLVATLRSQHQARYGGCLERPLLNERQTRFGFEPGRVVLFAKELLGRW
jgi:hypothetical protein